MRSLGKPDNTIRVRVWQPSDAVKKKTVKKAKKCKLPSPEPTYMADETVSNTDGSSNVGLELTIPGTTLSLWNSRDMFAGTRVPKEKISIFIDAANEDGSMENIGCCFLVSEGKKKGAMEKEF